MLIVWPPILIVLHGLLSRWLVHVCMDPNTLTYKHMHIQKDSTCRRKLTVSNKYRYIWPWIRHWIRRRSFPPGVSDPVSLCVTNAMIPDPVEHYKGPSWVNVLICLDSSNLLNTTTSIAIYHLSCCTV